MILITFPVNKFLPNLLKVLYRIGKEKKHNCFIKSKGLVTRSNFSRQLGGNQPQCTLQDHFGSTGVIFHAMS